MVKNADIVYCVLTSSVPLEQGNVKKYKAMMRIVHIEEKNLCIF